MGDAPLLLFSALYALCVGLFWKSVSTKQTRHTVGYLLLASVSAGLATSTKLNGVINLFHFLFCAPIFFYWLDRPLRFLKYQTAFIAVAYATFFLLNPFLWPNPYKNSLLMYFSRQVTIERQQERASEYGQALTSIPQRIAMSYNRTLAPAGAYSNFSHVPSVIPIGGLLVLLAVVFAVRTSRKAEQKSNVEVQSFVVWILFWIGITTALNPLDWDHYYLPVVVGFSFMQGYALTVVSEWLFTKLATTLNVVPK